MKKAPQPSANARAFGAGAACLAVALLVCGFTYVLRALDFAPLRALIIKEDHLYDAIHSPDVRLLQNAHRVVFIDIDDDAVRKWSTPNGAAPADAPLPNNTPRKLIAELARFARDARAKVIFLDFDFRDPLPDDDKELHAELARPDQPPILIPTFFTSGRLPACDDQAGSHPPTELNTIFADLAELSRDPPAGVGKVLPSIALVHPVLTLGAYGLPEGACSSYRVRFGSRGETVAREAAMVRAVELAIANSSGCEPADKCIKTVDPAHPELLDIRWTIGNGTDDKYDSDDNGAKTNGAKDNANSASNDRRLAYAHVKARLLVNYHGVSDPSAGDFGVLNDAIVVIGSTAQWSEDTLATPLGDLQGVLAHVNFALSLQSFNDEASLWVQIALDALFILIATAAAVFFCWRPIFRSLARGARLSMRQRLGRFFLEAGAFVASGVVFAAGSAALLGLGARFLAGWRFGVLTFIVGAIVGLMIEVCSAVGDSARELAEDWMTRRAQQHPKTSHERAPSIGSPTETPPP